MPALTPARRRALAGALLLVAVLVVAGRWAVRAGTPAEPARVETVAAAATDVAPTTAPEAAAPELVVHVVGAVAAPGLYRLPEGSRVADAVDRAGGATAKADLAALNLAAPVADGVQVVVPRRGGGGAVAGAGGSAPAGAGAPAPDGPVRLSTATLEQLDALPGVGPVTARKILDYRDANGGFRTVEELDAVPGIGPARLAELRELVAP